jgi:hypothetical protein
VPSTGAVIAQAAAAVHGHGGSLAQILLAGPWLKVVDIGGIEDQPKYRAIAAEARTLDRATISGIQTDRIEPAMNALNQIRGDCSVLHRS